MLTIFSTPKPFRGHEAVIQRNAIKSWTLLHPDCEIILFGDDEGASEVSTEFGIRHEPKVLRNEYGTKYLDYIFDRAQEIAKHDILSYVNCDIILMNDFVEAAQELYGWRKTFLMIGQRWDMDITESLDFGRSDWEDRLRALVLREGKQRNPQWIDYFVFSRGMYSDIPPFVIGRVRWDQWLVWKARSLKIPVVDASPTVIGVHQNHDYSYHKDGKEGVWHGDEAKRNLELAGGSRHLYEISDATHRLTLRGVRRHIGGYFRMKVRAKFWANVWMWRVVELTRPVRHPLGLHMNNFRRLKACLFRQ